MSDIRKRFEAWAKDAPREWEVDIHNGEGAWPGQYTEYHVQCAWEAWQAAETQAVLRCVEWIDAWSVHGDRVDNMKNSIKVEFPEAFHE
jgi:hypothetical protein